MIFYTERKAKGVKSLEYKEAKRVMEDIVRRVEYKDKESMKFH